MNAYDDLICTMHGSVMLIEINRPEKRNAMRLSLREELIAALRSVEDDDISAVVVTGVAGSAFSAGADLSELQTRTVDSEMSRSAMLRRELPAAAESCSKPIVAAINGACIGAGLEFALGCQIRIAAESAVFGMPEVRIGVPPGSGGTQRLTRVVGVGWSMHLVLEGSPVSADQALRMGLVTAVHPDDALVTEALRLAEAVGRQPRMAFVAARDAINRAFDVDLASGIDFERKLFALCLSTGVPQVKAERLLERISGGKSGSASLQ